MQTTVTTFRALFDELSSMRKAWVLKTGRNYFQVTERTMRRTINAPIEELSPVSQDVLRLIFETAQEARHAIDLESIDFQNLVQTKVVV